MQCPQCHHDVPVTEAQYGALYTCPKCMAVYFVNFDGLPEYGDMSLENLTSTSTDEVNQDLTSPTSESEVVHFENQFDQLPEASELHSFEHHSESNDVFLSDAPPSASSSFDIVAQEIQDFANQDEVVSELQYSVMIKGIDSKEIRDQFKESIEDSKFAWIAKDILDKIQNGECEIKGLNPIQAYVLAQRLQFLDLQCHWEQHVQV